MVDNLDLEPLLIVLGLIACAIFTLWSVLASVRNRVLPPARLRRRTTGMEFDTGHALSIRAGQQADDGSPSCNDDGD